MKKVFILTAILIITLTGCNSQTGSFQANLTITNSNGKVTKIACPGTKGCGRLEKSIDGDLYVESPRYSEDPQIASGSIDLTKPEFKPKRLPGTIKTKVGPPNLNKDPYKEGEVCFIVKYGPESIRVQGEIDGQKVDFQRNQEDECQAIEYDLWNSFFNVE